MILDAGGNRSIDYSIEQLLWYMQKKVNSKKIKLLTFWYKHVAKNNTKQAAYL